MSNKLTSLTGFGEGDPKPERKKIPVADKSSEKESYHFSSSGTTKRGVKRFGSGAKSSALHKKMGKEQHSWLDKHVDAQKKSQGKFHNFIRGGSHKSESDEVSESKASANPPRGTTVTYERRKSNLHKYLTGGK